LSPCRISGEFNARVLSSVWASMLSMTAFVISLVRSGEFENCSFELLVACCCRTSDSSVFSARVLAYDNWSPSVVSPPNSQGHRIKVWINDSLLAFL